MSKSKLSVQQETFARLLASGKSQREAYYEAGYKARREQDADSGASRLASNAKVADRIAQIRTQVDTKAINAVVVATAMNAVEVAQAFKELYIEARASEKFGDAINALGHIAKHIGFYAPEKQEQSGGLNIAFSWMTGETESNHSV